MLNTKHTFNNYIKQLVEDNFEGVHLNLEPRKVERKYPTIVVDWLDDDKTDTLAMWSSDVQIDVIYTANETLKCELTTLKLLRLLGLNCDKPGTPRSTPKLKFVDDAGNVLEHPQEYFKDSRVRWTLASNVQNIPDLDKPEVRRKSFNLNIHFKDNA